MSDPSKGVNPDLPEGDTVIEATAAPSGDTPTLPVIRFPPIPPVPAGVQIIPFKNFKECGIQIFSATDEEIDGLGIPTVPLRVPHNTDKRKTNAKEESTNDSRREESQSKGKGKGKRGPPTGPTEKLDPIARAQEQRRQRLLLFAKKEWYEQWAEGEDLRGTRTYDPNLSPIDRIHMAATEFRVGRIWPPGHMRVSYLWDQFRLYVGLLGSPPVWTRTDLPQQENSDEYDDETDSDVELAKAKKTKPMVTKRPKGSDEEDSVIYSDEDEDDIQPPRKQKQRHNADVENQVDQEIENAAQTRQKRIPPRTPYALYNLEPIPVSSDVEVRKLLAISAAKRESRLLKFLADPENSIRVFLSWYLRHEGLIWSPTHLISFPHLVKFFLAFLVRVRALPESERGLKQAVKVSERAIAELGRTGKLCRELPDKFGAGLQAMWGKRWEEEPWSFAFDGREEMDENLDSETPDIDKEAALKRFEEELRAANVQLLPADPADLGIPSVDLDVLEEEAEEELDTAEISSDAIVGDASAVNTVVGIQDAMTGELPVPQEVDKSAAGTAEILLPPLETDQRAPQSSDATSVDASQNIHPATENFDTDGAERIKTSLTSETLDQPMGIPVPPEPAVVENSEGFDWSKPGGKANASEVQAAKDAWTPSTVQPLMELFGMTTLPLKYDAGGRGGPNKIGVAERSMRKVKAVSKLGEGDKDRKWKGLEDDLTKRLSRVVLTPWMDWDDGNIAVEYRSPKIQGGAKPQTDENGEEQELSRHAAKYEHDPEKDDITLLVEPSVADLIMVGMGMAGTWVQLVPARDEPSRTHTGRGRGRGRGGGGRGGFAAGSGSKPQKEFTFWYVEDIYLAVPSFWTVGEEEKPITVEELEEALELDLEL